MLTQNDGVSVTVLTSKWKVNFTYNCSGSVCSMATSELFLMLRILPSKKQNHSSKKCTRKWLWNPEPRTALLCVGIEHALDNALCVFRSTTSGSLNGVISVLVNFLEPEVL